MTWKVIGEADLPDENEPVIIQLVSYNEQIIAWLIDDKFYDSYRCFRLKDVIAWQYLPEPYVAG